MISKMQNLKFRLIALNRISRVPSLSLQVPPPYSYSAVLSRHVADADGAVEEKDLGAARARSLDKNFPNLVETRNANAMMIWAIFWGSGKARESPKSTLQHHLNCTATNWSTNNWWSTVIISNKVKCELKNLMPSLKTRLTCVAANNFILKTKRLVCN